MQDKQEILESRMLAKAVIRYGDKIRIVAVFEKSTQRECFFVFSADKPNANPDDWMLQHTGTSYSLSGTETFDSYVMREKQMNFKNLICFIDVKYLVPREEFEDAFDRIANPMKHVKREPISAGASFELVNSRARRALFGTGPWFNTRDRSFDSLPSPVNEVLVYVDHCTDCGKNHMITHWPGGKTTCAGYEEMKNHPALTYMRHEGGQKHSTFIFEYRADVRV